MARNTLSRSLHDLGLAAWFGGMLANAVALSPAAAQSDTDTGPGRCSVTRMGGGEVRCAGGGGTDNDD